MKGAWIRYRWQEVCLVCGHGGRLGHGSGCMYEGDVDAPNAILCLRESVGAVKEARDGMGWIHRLRNDPNFRPLRHRPIVHVVRHPDHAHFTALAGTYAAALTPARLDWLVNNLDVSAASLTSLRLGWSEEHRAYAFPMHDHAGAIVGIRLRKMDGTKFAVTGGHEGVFLPDNLHTDGMLVTVEGASDTAAGIDLNLNVVGRPSCTGGIRHLTDLVR